MFIDVGCVLLLCYFDGVMMLMLYWYGDMFDLLGGVIYFVLMLVCCY